MVTMVIDGTTWQIDPEWGTWHRPEQAKP